MSVDCVSLLAVISTLLATYSADETFKDEEEDLDDPDVPEDKDVDEVPPMMTENIVGKEIVDDELMATRHDS